MLAVPKVLIVDDRRENLLALEALMQGLPVEAVTVTSGEDALKRLLVEEYAVLLLDAHMPGMDGFETAGHIKQRERTRHVPIIFLTAVDYDTRLAFRSYEAGAVDYITRPFDPWMLRAKVAVFADLWRTTAELAAQAEAARALEAESVALRSAIDDALAALSTVSDGHGVGGHGVGGHGVGGHGVGGVVGAAVQQARIRLEEVRPSPRIRLG